MNRLQGLGAWALGRFVEEVLKFVRFRVRDIGFRDERLKVSWLPLETCEYPKP